MVQYDLGKVVGEDGAKGDDGNGIVSIVKTSTSGLVDTYTITYTDGDTDTFTVTNGSSASVDIVTSWEQTLSDSKVPSEKLVKNSLPTKVSDLSNDSGFITSSALGNYVQKSNTNGLLKNDGTVDTSAYITSSALSNYVQTSSTTGLIKNDGTIMTGGTGSSNYAIGNHSHSGYVSATKVTSWSSTVSDGNVPSEKLVKDTIDDLIGEAIQYIQQ